MDSATPHSGPAFVHPSADVEDGAEIGAGTKVWHLAHIRSSATVGADCVIGRNVYVDANAVVGSRVKIQNNVSVYQGVTIEDEVFVGPCAVFTNDLRPRAQNADWKITPTLVRRGAKPYVSDPMYSSAELAAHKLPAYEGQEVGAAILQADHAEYRSLTSDDLPGVKVLVDGRRTTDPEKLPGIRRVVIGG